MFSGASQLTCKLVLDSATTVGANGVPGASSLTSVTLIVTFDRVGAAPAVPSPSPPQSSSPSPRGSAPRSSVSARRQLVDYDVERVRRLHPFQGVGQRVAVLDP